MTTEDLFVEGNLAPVRKCMQPYSSARLKRQTVIRLQELKPRFKCKSTDQLINRLMDRATEEWKRGV